MYIRIPSPQMPQWVRVYNCSHKGFDLRPRWRVVRNCAIVGPLYTLEPKTVGGTVFSYRFQIVQENPIASAWLMEFFGSMRFLVVTKLEGG